MRSRCTKQKAEQYAMTVVLILRISYRVDDVKIQTGTKTVNVPKKSHYETKVIGRKCNGCGKVEYY